MIVLLASQVLSMIPALRHVWLVLLAVLNVMLILLQNVLLATLVTSKIQLIAAKPVNLHASPVLPQQLHAANALQANTLKLASLNAITALQIASTALQAQVA